MQEGGGGLQKFNHYIKTWFINYQVCRYYKIKYNNKNGNKLISGKKCTLMFSIN